MGIVQAHLALLIAVLVVHGSLGFKPQDFKVIAVAHDARAQLLL